MICQAINLSGLATVSWVAGEDVRPGHCNCNCNCDCDYVTTLSLLCLRLLPLTSKKIVHDFLN